MILHSTKGVVLRTVKYGETSVIATMYTELFGMQSYMVKGVRTNSKRAGNKASYFQSGAILDMVVYHNELKHLQFIKEYNWAYLYQHVLFDITRNAIAMYIVELLLHTLKQPEANPGLFYLIENSLIALDKENATTAANLPLYFTLHLGSELGFQLQGEYSDHTPLLDLQAGHFVSHPPTHLHCLSGEAAYVTSRISMVSSYKDLSEITLNKFIRRELLEAYQQYIALHVNEFATLKSLTVLKEVL